MYKPRTEEAMSGPPVADDHPQELARSARQADAAVPLVADPAAAAARADLPHGADRRARRPRDRPLPIRGRARPADRVAAGRRPGSPGPVSEFAIESLLPKRHAVSLRRTRLSRVLGITVSDALKTVSAPAGAGAQWYGTISMATHPLDLAQSWVLNEFNVPQGVADSDLVPQANRLHYDAAPVRARPWSRSLAYWAAFW